MPKVSVVIPTYNRADLLGEAIASVLAQSYRDFEILVADDGSTDHTAQVVEQYVAQEGQRVRYLALPHRGQPAAPRNSAIAVAKGEFISFLDSDDLYLPNKLALQVPPIEANPNIGMVYSNGHYFFDDPTEILGYVQDGLPTPSGYVYDQLLRGNFITPSVMLARRDLLQQLGGFSEDPALFSVEDYDLFLRAAMQSEILYVPGDVSAIRRHGHNISGDALRLRSRCIHIFHKLDKQYPEVMARHAVARHEGYARHHGAVALAAWQQRKAGLALQHGFQAIRHTLQLPGGGLRPLRAWWDRRRLRSSAY